MNRALTLLLLLPAGCDILPHNCTMMYVPDTLAIDVEATSGWDGGAWAVSVDGELCTLTLPGGDDLVCDEGLSVALTDNGNGIAGLTLFGAPDAVEIVLERDGVEVFRDDVTPFYDETEPNGKGCGTSHSGAVGITLP